MPRVARIKSKSNIYHIMIRGINQQDIFTDDEDDEKFLVILDHYRQKIELEISITTTGNMIEKAIFFRTDTRVSQWKMMPIF